jgi:glyoxylase-like metal-dependent hydrolase (beta-lactamase superfamily II)
MEIIEIESDILLFQFESENRNLVGNNIFVMTDKVKALLIDTGFERHIREVIIELSKREIKIDIVIISHFHPDHFLGLKLFEGSKIIGSQYYKESIEIFVDESDPSIYFPDIKIDKKYKLKFGRHEIEMIENPGHSKCTIITQINKKYTHAGDEIIFTNDGRPVLPFVGLKYNKRHVESLNKLLSIKNRVVFPGHGSILIDENEVDNDIKNRIGYLNNVNTSNGNINYKDAVSRDYEFMNTKWHEYNCK